MAVLTQQKREEIKTLVMDVVKLMDNKKQLNVKRYSAMFDYLMANPSEFDKWASSMGHELDDTIQLFQLPFEEASMKQIKSAADYLNIPLEEYIYYRHYGPRGVRTKMKVPVGFVHIKRTQQILSKKNRYALDTQKTDLKTGQVTGESKVSTISDNEAFALSAIQADAALEEFMSARADNQSKKREMYKQIARDGYTELRTLPNVITEQTSLNTMNTYLLASGIRSDLITRGNSLKTAYTVDNESRGV